MTIIYTLIILAGAAFFYWFFLRNPSIPAEALRGYWPPKSNGRMSQALATFLDSITTLRSNRDNAAWKEWMDAERRSVRDLREIVHGRYRLCFKQRALLLLVAPQVKHTRVYPSLGKYGINENCLEDLPDELHEFAVTLIEASISTIAHHPDREELSSQYQFCIELLFPQVSQELQERLYPHFSLRDTFTFWNMDDASGYHPWRHLMSRRRVSDAWKKRMDADMRAIVMREAQGESKPRADFEDAFRWYLRVLSSAGFANRLPYGTDLYADQIAFALPLAEERGVCVFEGYCLQPALQHLDRDTHADLRQRMIASTWTHKQDGILRQEYLQQARKQLEEIREACPDVASIIQTAITEGEQAERERAAAEQAKAQLRVIRQASLR